MGYSTIYLENDEKRVKKVEGGKPVPNVVGEIVDVSVESQEKTVANGCPAYIVIGTTRYRI